jgi:hypothetical protein
MAAVFAGFAVLGADGETGAAVEPLSLSSRCDLWVESVHAMKTPTTIKPARSSDLLSELSIN